MLRSVVGLLLISSLCTSMLDAKTYEWRFDLPGDYLLEDPQAMEVAGGVARLLPLDQIDNTASDFLGGTLHGMQWQSPQNRVELVEANQWALPNNAAAGWIDMAQSTLLYHANEGSAATHFDDASGNANHLVCTSNCPTAGVAGKLGTALAFDGVNNRLQLSNPSNFPTTDVTLSMWIQVTKVSGKGTPISYAVAGGSDNELLLFNVNNLRFYLGGASSGNSGVSVADGRWHFLALTWQSSDGALRLYKDGALVFSKTMAAGSAMTSGGTLVLGQEQDSVGGGFQADQACGCRLDEVALHRRVMSAQEIVLQYTRQSPLYAGTMTSKIFDAEADALWLTVALDHEIVLTSVGALGLSMPLGAAKTTWQVRACDDATCLGEEFQGPDGTAGSYYAPAAVNAMPVALAALGQRRYFQYRLYLQSTDPAVVPAIRKVVIGPAHYPRIPRGLMNNAGIPYVQLQGMSEVFGTGHQGSTRYQISNNGTSWYHHNGLQWSTTADPMQANSAHELQSHLATFATDVATGNLFFRALLSSSDGQVSPVLDSLLLTYDDVLPEPPPTSAPNELPPPDSSDTSESPTPNAQPVDEPTDGSGATPPLEPTDTAPNDATPVEGELTFGGGCALVR